MNKTAIGALAGLALVGAAVTSYGSAALAEDSSDTTLHVASTAAPVKAAAAKKTTAKATPKKTTAKATPKKTTPKATPKPVVKTVRKVALVVPKDSKVGANVTGYIQVTDVTGTVSKPVEGVTVSLQQKRGTSSWVEMSTGDTNVTGRLDVSFTSRTNLTWRAAIKPASGSPVYSAAVVTTASAQVNWAARPDMEVKKGVKTPYSFRIVTPTVGSLGQLQYTQPAAPKKWISFTPAKAGPDGIVTQYITFAKPGTYQLRGASVKTATNSAGYSTIIQIKVT